MSQTTRMYTMTREEIVDFFARNNCETCPAPSGACDKRRCAEVKRDWLNEKVASAPIGDYEVLRQAIIRAGHKPSWVADKIGLDRNTFSQRMTGKSFWKSWEMFAIADLLDMSVDELFRI